MWPDNVTPARTQPKTYRGETYLVRAWSPLLFIFRAEFVKISTCARYKCFRTKVSAAVQIIKKRDYDVNWEFTSEFEWKLRTRLLMWSQFIGGNALQWNICLCLVWTPRLLLDRYSWSDSTKMKLFLLKLVLFPMHLIFSSQALSLPVRDEKGEKLWWGQDRPDATSSGIVVASLAECSIM